MWLKIIPNMPAVLSNNWKPLRKHITLTILRKLLIASCLPTQPLIRLSSYINGYFCYTYKFGIITNGLGIVRDITFYNKNFPEAHSNITIENKCNSSDEDKRLADSKALILCYQTQIPKQKAFARWFSTYWDYTACYRNGCWQNP